MLGLRSEAQKMPYLGRQVIEFRSLGPTKVSTGNMDLLPVICFEDIEYRVYKILVYFAMYLLLLMSDI